MTSTLCCYLSWLGGLNAVLLPVVVELGDLYAMLLPVVELGDFYAVLLPVVELSDLNVVLLPIVELGDLYAVLLPIAELSDLYAVLLPIVELGDLYAVLLPIVELGVWDHEAGHLLLLVVADEVVAHNLHHHVQEYDIETDYGIYSKILLIW